MKVEIYGRASCPYCDKAKNAFTAAGIEYTFITVDGVNVKKEDIQSRIDALGIHHTVATVPQIFVDDNWIGGYDRLVATFPWAKVYNDSLR